MEKISIIMGIYNCADTLEKCVDSIMAQTYENWELIMCDDGSKDDTYLVAEKYSNAMPDKFILLRNDRNLGLQRTLNKCLEHASGEFIARQDGDDYSKPERLEKELKLLLEHREYAFVSSNMILADENGEWGRTSLPEQPTKKDFLNGAPFCHAPVLIRRGAIVDAGGYNESAKYNRIEDFYLWTVLYSKGYKGYNIQEPLYVMLDDSKATKRRTKKSRITAISASVSCYRMLGLPPVLYIKPIIIGVIKIFVPARLSQYLHRKKMKK